MEGRVVTSSGRCASAHSMDPITSTFRSCISSLFPPALLTMPTEQATRRGEFQTFLTLHKGEVCKLALAVLHAGTIDPRQKQAGEESTTGLG